MYRSKIIASAIGVALAASLLILGAAPSVAQQNNITGAARITNTARVPGTYAVMGTPNLSGKGIYCTIYQSAEVGLPSTVVSVEVEDAASLTWQTFGSTAALDSTGATSKSVLVYPGAVATSVPTNLAIYGLKVPQIWRLKMVITGGTSTTGTADCDLLN